MKKLLIALFTLITVSSFSQLTYTVTKGITTNVNCNVGDTLKFYAQVSSAYGIQINGITTTSVHPVTTSPYYIGYHVAVGGDNSFTILGSPNWSGTLTVQSATGINQLSNKDIHVKIFPNPVGNELKITTNADNSKVEIFSINGQLVFTDKLKKGDNDINFESYARGVYIVRVGNKETRIIKE